MALRTVQPTRKSEGGREREGEREGEREEGREEGRERERVGEILRECVCKREETV
jgi:hypothetical protein